MKATQESKVQGILRNWINGNKKSAAEKVNKLTKYELAHCLGSMSYSVMPELVNKETRYNWENFIINALDGMYK